MFDALEARNFAFNCELRQKPRKNENGSAVGTDAAGNFCYVAHNKIK